jgi:hypothetical protein
MCREMPSGWGIPEITGVLFFQNALWDLCVVTTPPTTLRISLEVFMFLERTWALGFSMDSTLHAEKITNSKAPKKVS